MYKTVEFNIFEERLEDIVYPKDDAARRKAARARKMRDEREERGDSAFKKLLNKARAFWSRERLP
jgi:hypothetical protein